MSITGGTAGCVLASRLAQASPELSILIIEGGQDNSNLPEVTYPALFRTNLVPHSGTCLHYKNVQEAQTNHRDLHVPVGGVLGGSSSVNGLLYVRAQRSDYDSWNTTGWSTDELLPYLQKVRRDLYPLHLRPN
jgi:alcohol oxidase